MTYFHALLTAKAYTLMLPVELREDVDRYVLRHQPGSRSSELAPFRRRLDLWAYSVATAVALGLEPVADQKAVRGYKFKDTRSVEMSADLCTLLVAAAVAGLGPSDERARAPAEIVKFANRLAAAGAPVVIERLRTLDLRTTPLDKVRSHAEEMLKQVGAVDA